MEIQKYQEKIFEDIKHVNEEGVEYWEVRELMKVLGYHQCRNFKQVIDKAMSKDLPTLKASNQKLEQKELMAIVFRYM